MKIKFVHHLATPSGNYPVDAVMELDDARAKTLIKDGVAVEFKGDLKGSVEDRTLLPNGVAFEQPTCLAPVPPAKVLPSGVAVAEAPKPRHNPGAKVDTPDELTVDPEAPAKA